MEVHLILMSIISQKCLVHLPLNSGFDMFVCGSTRRGNCGDTNNHKMEIPVSADILQVMIHNYLLNMNTVGELTIYVAFSHWR